MYFPGPLIEVIACIASGNGTIKRIETQYPGLEEMLVKIGEQREACLPGCGRFKFTFYINRTENIP